MVIPGISNIQKDLSTTATIASWITSAFLIVGAAVSPLFGKLGDIYGKKKIFLTVLALLHCRSRISWICHKHIHAYSFKSHSRHRLCHSSLGISHYHRYFPKRTSSHCSGHNQRNLRHRRRRRLNHRRIHSTGLKLAMGFPHRLHSKHNSVLHCSVALKKDVPGEKSKVDIIGATMLMSGIVLVLLYLN